jgi:AcrR family transcriptional regulator
MSRESIMDCAFELFSKGCYNGVSLSEIAEKAGIKKPSIYAHFASKEELFLAILDNELEKIYSIINVELNKVEGFSAELALYKLLKRFVEYNFNNPMSRGLWRCIFYTPHLSLYGQINARTRTLDEKMRSIQLKIMKQGIDRGEIKEQDVDYLIYSYSCLIKGNFAMVLRDPDYSLEKLNFCWGIYWSGIKNA